MAIYHLGTPISESDARKLRIRDTLFISGLIFTARDQAHRRALEVALRGDSLPFSLKGMAVFHCGPIVQKKNEDWQVVAAGPTTSTRMDSIEGQFIERFEVRIVVGKGGMGAKTADAMRRFGAAYCDFTGGAAVLAAKSIRKVKGVWWLDLGVPEAVWIFEVENFGPLTVAIDSLGQNLHGQVSARVEENRSKIHRMLEAPSRVGNPLT